MYLIIEKLPSYCDKRINLYNYVFFYAITSHTLSTQVAMVLTELVVLLEQLFLETLCLCCLKAFFLACHSRPLCMALMYVRYDAITPDILAEGCAYMI